MQQSSQVSKYVSRQFYALLQYDFAKCHHCSFFVGQQVSFSHANVPFDELVFIRQ